MAHLPSAGAADLGRLESRAQHPLARALHEVFEQSLEMVERILHTVTAVLPLE
jgi:hypothetical protein